jgi:hypothetical protein
MNYLIHRVWEAATGFCDANAAGRKPTPTNGKQPTAVFLEHFHKFCSVRLRPLRDSGVFGFWRRFGSVTGVCNHAPSPKPCQKPKTLAPHRYIISVNALAPVTLIK